jgi:hypothetical protein
MGEDLVVHSGHPIPFTKAAFVQGDRAQANEVIDNHNWVVEQTDNPHDQACLSWRVAGKIL